MADNNNKSFFQTLPGVMTATATLITAVVGLITVLNQVGLIGDKNKEKPKTEKVVDADKPTPEKVNVANTADLEKIIKKVMAEEKATKGKSEEDIEATVKKIVKDVKKEETSKKTSNETIKKIAKAYLLNNKQFDKEEDVYHGEPDDDYIDPPIIPNINVSGTWTDNNTGASYVFSQNGNSIVFQEHSVNNFGVPIVSAEGSGTISNRNITVNYITMFNTNGVANMTVSPNGSNITGAFRDNVSGAVVNMNLWR